MEQDVPLDAVLDIASTGTGRDGGQSSNENKAEKNESNQDKQTGDATKTETNTDSGNTNISDEHKLEDKSHVDATVKDIAVEKIDDEMCAKFEKTDEKVESSVETNTDEQLPQKETGNEADPESVSNKIETVENNRSDEQDVGGGTADGDSNRKGKTEKPVSMQTDVTKMEVCEGGDVKIGDDSGLVSSQDVPKNPILTPVDKIDIGAGDAQEKKISNENQNDVNNDVQESKVAAVVECEATMETDFNAKDAIDAKQCDQQSAESDTETKANVKETENTGRSSCESAIGTNSESIKMTIDLEGSEVKIVEGATQRAEVLDKKTTEDGKTNDGDKSATEIAKPKAETNDSTNIDVTKDESQIELKTNDVVDKSSVENNSSGGGKESITEETVAEEPMESEQEMKDDASNGTIGENVNGNANEEKENKSELANGTSSTEEDSSVKTNGEVEKMSDEDVKVKILEGAAESTPVSVEV